MHAEESQLISSHEGKQVLAFETWVERVSEYTDSDDDRVETRKTVLHERGGVELLTIRSGSKMVHVPLGAWRPSVEDWVL